MASLLKKTFLVAILFAPFFVNAQFAEKSENRPIRFTELVRLLDRVASSSDTVQASTLVAMAREYINAGNTFPGGGGGTAYYLQDSVTTVTIGGLPSGTNIYNWRIDSVLEAIVAPYVNPSFASFSSPSLSNTVEVGTIVSGSQTFTWSFNDPGNVQPNSADVYDVTGGAYIGTNLPGSPASVNIGTIQLNSAGSYRWRGEASNTKGGTFTSSNFEVDWKNKRYWGFDNDTTYTNADLLALSQEFTNNRDKTLNNQTPTGSQHFFYVYPAYMGTATITVNGFPSNNAFYEHTINLTNAQGVTQSFLLYRTKNALTSATTIIFD